MKRITAAAVLALCGAAFAQNSNTKTATAGLITDGVVDKLATGTGNDTLLFFGGYDFNAIQAQAGLGYQFGNLWVSAYDAYSLSANTTESETAKADSVAKDGVNTDYTDETNTASVSGSSTFKNTLKAAAFWNNRFGAQFYWTANNTNYSGFSTNPIASLSGLGSGTTTTKNSDEDHAAGTTTNTEYGALENKTHNNTFGLDFNGIQWKADNDLAFYVKLDKIEVALADTYRKAAWATDITLNGSTVGAGAQTSYEGEYQNLDITPKVQFQLGLNTAKLFDRVGLQVVLVESFAPTFRSYTDTYSNTTVTETATTRTTTANSYDSSYPDYFKWENVLTPRLNFSFDAGDSVILKARIDVPVTLGGETYSARESTKTERTATYDKTTGTTTYTTKETTQANGRNYDYFSTTVNPQFMLGLVYKVKPGKFNINVGAKLNSGALTWTTKENTNSDTGTRTVTTSTNAAGETTTTSVKYTSSSNDTAASGENPTANDKSTTFKSDTPSAAAYLGGTWFLTDNIQFDTLLGTAATNSNLTWKLNLQFGFKF